MAEVVDFVDDAAFVGPGVRSGRLDGSSGTCCRRGASTGDTILFIFGLLILDCVCVACGNWLACGCSVLERLQVRIIEVGIDGRASVNH